MEGRALQLQLVILKIELKVLEREGQNYGLATMEKLPPPEIREGEGGIEANKRNHFVQYVSNCSSNVEKHPHDGLVTAVKPRKLPK